MTRYKLPCVAVLALTLPLAAGANHKHHIVVAPTPPSSADDVIGIIFEQIKLSDMEICLKKAFGPHGSGTANVGNVHCLRNIDDPTGIAAIMVHKSSNGLDNAMIAIEDSPQQGHLDVTLAHATKSGPWTTESHSYADNTPVRLEGGNSRLLPFVHQVVDASIKLHR